jgi:hypothetical protein
MHPQLSLQEFLRYRLEEFNIKGETYPAFSNLIHDPSGLAQLSFNVGEPQDFITLFDVDSVFALLDVSMIDPSLSYSVQVPCSRTYQPYPEKCPLSLPNEEVLRLGLPTSVMSENFCAGAFKTLELGEVRVYLYLPKGLGSARSDWLRLLYNTHQITPSLRHIPPPINEVSLNPKLRDQWPPHEDVPWPVIAAGLQVLASSQPVYVLLSCHQLKKCGPLFINLTSTKQVQAGFYKALEQLCPLGLMGGIVDVGLRILTHDPTKTAFLTRASCQALFQNFSVSKLEDYSLAGVREFSSMTAKARKGFHKVKVYHESFEAVLNTPGKTVLQTGAIPLPVIGHGILDGVCEASSKLVAEANKALEPYLTCLGAYRKLASAQGGALRVEVRIGMEDFPLGLSSLEWVQMRLGNELQVIVEPVESVFKFASAMIGSLLRPLKNVLSSMTVLNDGQQMLAYMIAELLQTQVVCRQADLYRRSAILGGLIDVEKSLQEVGYISLAYFKGIIDLDRFSLEAFQTEIPAHSRRYIDNISIKNAAYNICRNRKYEIACYLQARAIFICNDYNEADFTIKLGECLLNIVSAIGFQILKNAKIICEEVNGRRIWFNRGPFEHSNTSSSFQLIPECLAPFIKSDLYNRYSMGLDFPTFIASHSPKANIEEYFGSLVSTTTIRDGYLSRLSGKLKDVPFFLYRFMSEAADKYGLQYEDFRDALCQAYILSDWSIAPIATPTSFCTASSRLGVQEFCRIVGEPVTEGVEDQIASSPRIEVPLQLQADLLPWHAIPGVPDRFPEDLENLLRENIMRCRTERELLSIQDPRIVYRKVRKLCDMERLSLEMFRATHNDTDLLSMYLHPHSGLTRLVPATSSSPAKLLVFHLCRSMMTSFSELVESLIPETDITKGQAMRQVLLGNNGALALQILAERDRIWALPINSVTPATWYTTRELLDYQRFTRASQ